MPTVDDWVWGDESLLTREEKRDNAFAAKNNKDDNSSIRYYRFLCCALYLAHQLYTVYLYGPLEIWSYFWLTEWGWLLYGIYIFLATFYHWRHDIRGVAQAEYDSKSPFSSWKVITIMFQVSLALQSMITVVFWILLYN